MRERAGSMPARSIRWFIRGRYEAWSGLSSNDGRGLNQLPARSDGLDNVDGGPDAAFYIQMRVIQQVRIRSGFQGRGGAILVAFVALEDISQHRGLVGVLTPGSGLQGAAAGPDFRVGNDEDLHIGMRTDHGPDVAPVKHRARRIRGELPLKVQ